jgi:5-methylcytosine-specific restriction protein B
MIAFCQQDALDLIKRDLIDKHLVALGAQEDGKRRRGLDRTKAQIFRVLASGKQFAVMLGKKSAETQRFDGEKVRVVLESDAPHGLIDVTPLEGHKQLKSSALKDTSGTRLTAGHQHFALVESESGLRELLSWYLGQSVHNHVGQVHQVELPAQAETSMTQSPANEATNTILCGPPGTGKTYSTTARAVELCDGAIPASHDGVKARFEALRADKRISFVTFHQSYGYEEFIEGLRPHVEAGHVVYNVEPGVFKKACDAARRPQLARPELKGKSLRDHAVFKMSLGASRNDEGTKVFEYCLKNECVLLGWGDDIDFSACDSYDAIVEKLKQAAPDIDKLDSHVNYVERFKHKLKVGDLILVSNGNLQFRGIAEVTGEYEFAEDAPFHQMRRVRWLANTVDGWPADDFYAKSVVQQTLYELSADYINWEQLQKILGLTDDATGTQHHVIIIDEINRANISKVFGELITLIERDKREGADNSITVKLPYSGNDFSVPANLHIIGTMNTADRSIALLDTALRRRFDFVEVMPEPLRLQGKVINGVDLMQLLSALNDRVEVLYDRDHTIGHAYFMSVQTLDDLDAVFRRKVLPLLQEYFFENWSKVRRALNDLGEGNFIRKELKSAVLSDGEEDEADERAVVYSVNPQPFPVAAYQHIYAK